MIEGLFWLCALLLGYVHLGYPALIRAWAGAESRPRRHLGVEPTVCLLLVAYNEADRIAGRVENLLGLDYRREKLEIVLASDGSTDATPEMARAYEPEVTVIAFETRRGKPTVLNDLVPKLRGEIVVLTDARQRFEASALRMLVEPFADPHVGAVSGELILTGDGGGTRLGEGVGLYWRYEKFIRANESRADSTIGATGAIYAIRRDLFEPIPEDTILDDVLIPVRIARRGYRVLFEPRALAYDRVAAKAGEEFARKVRTIAGNFQLFARERWLLNPFKNRLWLQTVSHKGLRLLNPLLLSGALVINFFILARPFYQWMLGAQLLFYGAALGGYLLRNAGGKSPFLSVPYVLCLLSWATVVAFFRFATGRQRVTWEKAPV